MRSTNSHSIPLILVNSNEKVQPPPLPSPHFSDGRKGALWFEREFIIQLFEGEEMEGGYFSLRSVQHCQSWSIKMKKLKSSPLPHFNEKGTFWFGRGRGGEVAFLFLLCPRLL